MAMAGAIGMGIQAAGNILGGISAYQRSKAAAKTLSAIGLAAYQDRLIQGARLKGAQRAAFAKGGVDINTGSPLDVQAETAGFEFLAAEQIRQAYKREARATKLAGQAALMSGLSLGGGQAAEGVIRYLGQGTGSQSLGSSALSYKPYSGSLASGSPGGRPLSPVR